MKTYSVTANDRHVILSSPLVDTKYENIWGVFGQIILPITKKDINFIPSYRPKRTII